MTTKVFKAIFISTMIAAVVSFFVAYWFALGTLTADAVAMVLVAIILLTLVIARLLAGDIVRPISDIDPDRPERALEVYGELKPMVDKLTQQKRRVAKQMEELKARENEFISITSNMNDGMLIINSAAEIITVNQAAEKILGIDGLPRTALRQDDPQGLKDAVGEALQGRNGYYDFSRGDKHYSLIATPVLREGIGSGAVVFIIDDTEKEEREALRREFTSNVSHELKTPLTSISGFAELIGCGMAEGEDARRFAENITREAKRLISLVGDIIRLTQLDGGEIPFDGEITLIDVARETVGRLENIAEASGVTLSAEGNTSTVLGTRQILEELVYNLVDNGIKYNRKGGYVKVKVCENEDGVILTVEDNGIGIPADKQDRVFERFYRVDKSHSKEIGGTGLGLSIVKHAALYHKAKIALSSREGEGTSISLTFPKAE